MPASVFSQIHLESKPRRATWPAIIQFDGPPVLRSFPYSSCGCYMLLFLSLARTVDGLLWQLHVSLSNLGSIQQTTLVKFASNGDAILSCCEAERILGLVCCLVVFGSVGQSLDVFPFGGPNGLRTNRPPS